MHHSVGQQTLEGIILKLTCAVCGALPLRPEQLRCPMTVHANTYMYAFWDIHEQLVVDTYG